MQPWRNKQWRIFPPAPRFQFGGSTGSSFPGCKIRLAGTRLGLTLVNQSFLPALTTASFRVPVQGCRSGHFLCSLDKGLFIQSIFLTAFPKDHKSGEQPCAQTSHGSPRPQPCTHISGSGFASDACRLPSDTRLIRDAPAWPEPDNAFSLPAAPPSPPEVRDGQSFYSSPGSKTSPALLVNLLCSLTRVRHNILILKSCSETKTKQEHKKTPVSSSPCLEKINSHYAPIARAQRCPLFHWKLCDFSAPIPCVTASILALHWLMNKPHVFTVSRLCGVSWTWRSSPPPHFLPGCSHRWPWELCVTTKQPLLLKPKAWEVRLAVLLLHRGSGAAGSELCSRK